MRCALEGGDDVELGFHVADDLMRGVLEGDVAVQFVLEGGKSNVLLLLSPEEDGDGRATEDALH